MNNQKTIVPKEYDTLSIEDKARLMVAFSQWEDMDEETNLHLYEQTAGLMHYLSFITQSEMALQPDTYNYLGKKFNTRFTPGQVIERLVHLAYNVERSMNARYLTREEINLGVHYAMHLRMFSEKMRDAFASKEAATKSLVPIAPWELYRRALNENRELWGKLESARKIGNLAKEQLDHIHTENRRLRARERELIALYRSMSYDDYLKTPHWQETRAAAIARAGGKCSMCSSTERLQVHHNTYERLGGERPEDLAVVCRPCHAKHHGKAA